MASISDKWIRHLWTQARVDSEVVKDPNIDRDVETPRSSMTKLGGQTPTTRPLMTRPRRAVVQIRDSAGNVISPERFVNGSRTRNDTKNEYKRGRHKDPSDRQFWTSEDSVQTRSPGPLGGFTVSPTSLAKQDPSTNPYGPARPAAPPASSFATGTESPPAMTRQPETRPIPEHLYKEPEIHAILRQAEDRPIPEHELNQVREDIAKVKMEAAFKYMADKVSKVQLQDLTELHNMDYYHPFAKPHPSSAISLLREFAPMATGTSRHDTDLYSLKDYRVEASIGKQRVDALADTGAQSNFISQQFVEKLGIASDNGIPRRIELPGGKQVLSPGTVTVPFSFFGEVKEHLLECLIIPGCTSELILSGAFLRVTKTLTTFKSRIKERIRQIKKSTIRLNLLGNERQRLWGSLNNSSALALPDTGSDVMLVSAEFARKNKFKIDHDPQHRLELELADGSRLFTTGIVSDAMWTFGDSSQSIYSDFYVLNDLSVDVVLSNDFIFKHDVFSEFDSFMIDLDSMPDLSEFYNVRLISKFSDELTRLEEESINDMSSPYARKAERVRRDRIRDAINALDEAEQNEAWKAEGKRQLIWDRHHKRHKHKADLGDAGQRLPQGGSQDLSNPKHRWWKKITLWTRVNGGPKGK